MNKQIIITDLNRTNFLRENVVHSNRFKRKREEDESEKRKRILTRKEYFKKTKEKENKILILSKLISVISMEPRVYISKIMKE